MATAILDGVVRNGLFSPSDIIISNPSAQKLHHPQSLGVNVTCDNKAVVSAADVIILAVKPQKFEEVIDEIKDLCVGKCFVSIAAGISTQWLSERLQGANVIRVMPNTPLQLGMGATAIAKAEQVPDELFQITCDIFSEAGEVSVISEELMDHVIPVSGSSPAFYFRMVDVIVKWASENGMDADVALILAATTMKGAAEMLLHSGKTAEELIQQVCSPGGTTLAALSAFDDGNFDAVIRDGMDRCTARSKELGK